MRQKFWHLEWHWRGWCGCGERQRSTLVDVVLDMPTLVDVVLNMPTLVDVVLDMPTLVDVVLNMPTLVDVVLDMRKTCLCLCRL